MGTQTITSADGTVARTFKVWPDGELSEICGRCGGKGRIQHFSYIDAGICYGCMGSGIASDKDGAPIARTAEKWQSLIDAQAKRRAAKDAKRVAANKAANEKRDAFKAAHPDVVAWLNEYGYADMYTSPKNQFAYSLRETMLRYGALTPNQLTAARNAITRDAERKAAHEVKASESRHLGTVGEKITVTGKIDRVRDIESVFNGRPVTSYLVALTTDDGQSVNTFTTAKWVHEVHEGDSITLTGTVKKHSDYQGVAQTTLTRCKMI